MLTVGSDKRANIADICSHWWVNDGYGGGTHRAGIKAGLRRVGLWEANRYILRRIWVYATGISSSSSSRPCPSLGSHSTELG